MVNKLINGAIVLLNHSLYFIPFGPFSQSLFEIQTDNRFQPKEAQITSQIQLFFKLVYAYYVRLKVLGLTQRLHH